MAKRKRTRRKRSTAETVMLVLGILIALSMILSLLVGLGGRRATPSNAPLPFESWHHEAAELDGSTSDGSVSTEAVPSAGMTALLEF
jgi:hypothetical protein